MAGLMMHAGGKVVNMQELGGVWTPAPTETWQPVPHITVINEVLRNLEANMLAVANYEMGIAKDGARFFSVIEISNGLDDYSLVIGVRNSHDKSFPAGLAVGSKVFVCDNLAFSAEIVFNRKHTVNIMRDFPGLVAKSMAKLTEYRGLQSNRIDNYKKALLEATDVHDFLIRSVDSKIIANADIPKVLKKWREGYLEEEMGDTGWRLFNCYTEVLKHIAVADLPPRTMRLHGMLDAITGVVNERVN